MTITEYIHGNEELKRLPFITVFKTIIALAEDGLLSPAIEVLKDGKVSEL